MVTALRPLSTGELLDRTFSLYRTHFPLFVGIAALPHLVLLAFQLVGATLRPEGSIPAMVATIAWTFAVLFVSLCAGAATQAATVIAVSQVHLDRPATVLDAFSRVKHRIVSVVLLTVVVSLAVGMGFILLIVPGVILALMWSLAVPVAVLENKGLGESMFRSSQLTKGDRGRVFVVWILFIVLTLAVSTVLQWPIILAAAAVSRGAAGGSAWFQVASAVATFISQSLVAPLLTIALSLVYYDERVRKEAFDLQLMMTNLDGSPAGMVPTR